MRWELSFYPVLEVLLRKTSEQLLSGPSLGVVTNDIGVDGLGFHPYFHRLVLHVAGANPARGGTTARLQETPTRAKWTIYEQHPEM